MASSKEKQTDGRIDKNTYTQTGMQTDAKTYTDKQVDRMACKSQTNRHTGR